MHSVSLIQMNGKNVYVLKLNGFLQLHEMQDVMKKAEQLLRTPVSDFRVYSDIRGFKPASTDVQEVMKDIQKLFRMKGLKKVAVLVDNAITKMQLQRLHQETRIRGADQFFAADEEGYEQAIEAFLTKE